MPKHSKPLVSMHATREHPSVFYSRLLSRRGSQIIVMEIFLSLKSPFVYSFSISLALMFDVVALPRVASHERTAKCFNIVATTLGWGRVPWEKAAAFNPHGRERLFSPLGCLRRWARSHLAWSFLFRVGQPCFPLPPPPAAAAVAVPVCWGARDPPKGSLTHLCSGVAGSLAGTRRSLYYRWRNALPSRDDLLPKVRPSHLTSFPTFMPTLACTA